MKQKALLEFVDAGELICERVNLSKPPAEINIFEAETAELFRALFKSSRGRYPSAADWNRYFGLHPDEFARISGRSWEKAKAEVRKMVEKADAALKRQNAMKARAEEADE